jgi:SPFH domain / Band 7 family
MWCERAKMKKRLALTLMGALFAIGMAGCTTASPDAGHQAVWVEKPVFFGHGGVDPTPVTTGKQYGAVSSDAVDVTMQPQRIDMEFDDMMTKSGVPVSFHVLFVFQVEDSVKLVQGFGVDSNGEAKGAWTRVVDPQINQLVRDTVKAYEMQDIALSQISVDAASASIKDGTLSIVKSTGLPITMLSVNVGRILPPDAVKNQRIETAAQEQRVITMQQTKLAEDARKLAEESRAAADNAYKQQMGLSPEQFVEMSRIQMQEKVCSNGGCTFILGGGTPLINVK